MKTGICLRIERNGKWEAFDVAELTEEEVKTFFSAKTTDELLKWIAALVRIFRETTEGAC